MLPMANLAQRFLESVITERPGLSDRSFTALRFSDFEPVPACEHSLDAPPNGRVVGFTPLGTMPGASKLLVP